MSMSTSKVDQPVGQPAQSSFPDHSDPQDLLQQAVKVRDQLNRMIGELAAKPAEGPVSYRGFCDSRFATYGNTTVRTDETLPLKNEIRRLKEEIKAKEREQSTVQFKGFGDPNFASYGNTTIRLPHPDIKGLESKIRGLEFRIDALKKQDSPPLRGCSILDSFLFPI